MQSKIIENIKFWLRFETGFLKKKKVPEPDFNFQKYKLNLKQAPVDPKDYVKATLPPINLPSSIDYSRFVTVKDQGWIGSCNSFAAVNGMEMLCRMLYPEMSADLSEMYLYWLVRQKEYENTFPQDSGAHGANIMSVINHIGIAPESIYPYITTSDVLDTSIPIEKDYFNQGPKISISFANSVARFWKASIYERCYSVESIKSALFLKEAVWLGIPIQKSFQTYNNYSNPIEFDESKEIFGGHAMCVVGYDDSKKVLKVVNSWNTTWGQEGFGLISYDYLKQAPWFDCWSFRK